MDNLVITKENISIYIDATEDELIEVSKDLILSYPQHNINQISEMITNTAYECWNASAPRGYFFYYIFSIVKKYKHKN